VISELVSSSVAAICYFLLYPLEVMNTRMSVEVEKKRFY
jgi:hypothetical protein